MEWGEEEVGVSQRSSTCTHEICLSPSYQIRPGPRDRAPVRVPPGNPVHTALRRGCPEGSIAGAQHHTPTRHPAHHQVRGTTHHAAHHPPDALSTASFLSSPRRLAKRSRVRRRVSPTLPAAQPARLGGRSLAVCSSASEGGSLWGKNALVGELGCKSKTYTATAPRAARNVSGQKPEDSREPRTLKEV